jgi:hypothetical protein
MEQRGDAWDAAAKALDLIRAALAFRMLLLLLAIAFVTLLLFRTPSTETSLLLRCWLDVAETLVTIVAFVGVARFVTRTPEGHAGVAGFAPLYLGVALFAQIYRVWIDLELVQAASTPIRGLGKHVADLPYVEIASSCGVLLALGSVIGGVASVARALANQAVVRRARGLSVTLALLAGAVGVFGYWGITTRPEDSAFVIWLVLAVFALGALFLSAGTLAMASDAMRAGPRQTLPGARVVTGT